jgi:formaldehyde-activating enzyme involved in methanogenesis
MQAWWAHDPLMLEIKSNIIMKPKALTVQKLYKDDVEDNMPVCAMLPEDNNLCQ